MTAIPTNKVTPPAAGRPAALVDRLAAWSEQARRGGRVERADELLLHAFQAYDEIEFAPTGFCTCREAVPALA